MQMLYDQVTELIFRDKMIKRSRAQHRKISYIGVSMERYCHSGRGDCHEAQLIWIPGRPTHSTRETQTIREMIKVAASS